MTLTRRDVGLLVLLTLLWGVNWPMMKFSLREMTPLWFRAVTMGGGALSLYLFYRWRGVSMALPRHEIARIVWLALPNIIGWHFFSIIGLKELASGRAAILGFTMPVWTVLIGLLLAHERMTPRVWISVIAAVAAIALLSAQELAQLAGRPLGVLWMQFGALSWAVGTLLMRRTRTTLPNEAVTVWMMLIGSAFFWCVAPWVEPLPSPSTFGITMWARARLRHVPELRLRPGAVVRHGAPPAANRERVLDHGGAARGHPVGGGTDRRDPSPGRLVRGDRHHGGDRERTAAAARGLIRPRTGS